MHEEVLAAGFDAGDSATNNLFALELPVAKPRVFDDSAFHGRS
jgi:hypothetical protein